MATTQNTYTGNGSTTNFSFTFEYIKQSDVKVTLDSVATTAFKFANATTVSFTSAPASGKAIRIYRDTDITELNATFFPGSAIKAEDLNNNFTQTHFATQETDNEVLTANTTADTAKTTANSAVTTANSAVTTANAATAKANTAATNASSAVTTANAASSTAATASTNASAAVVTANAASAAVTNAVLFSLVANVAGIPDRPSNNDYIEIGDSTGIQSFSPLSGLPSGFTGASGLTVRVRYDSSASSWVFMNYFANDSEDRYATIDAPTFTGSATFAGMVKSTISDTNANCFRATHTGTGGTAIQVGNSTDTTVRIKADGNAIFDGSGSFAGNAFQVGDDAGGSTLRIIQNDATADALKIGTNSVSDAVVCKSDGSANLLELFRLVTG